jgi:hypothetical protein
MQTQQGGGRRRGGGTRERGKGRKRKEVARTAGCKATGAWMIGGRGGRRRAMEGGYDERPCAVGGAGDRHRHVSVCVGSLPRTHFR